MLGNEQVKNLIIAMGTGVGEQFSLENLRYHRVIIMTDADVDGAHIRTLLLTLFYRYFPDIIKAGYLYIAQPPLFRIQSGKTSEYAFSERQRNEIIERTLSETKEKKAKSKKDKGALQEIEQVLEQVPEQSGEVMIRGINVQRYKGLGEMNPQQLWETTMDPVNRVMYRVNIEDAERTNKIFETLMGDEVAPRKNFIQSHAKAVKNLDI
jgi:DNA gyrase subunit B